MEREKARLAAAHLKNLEYIRRLDAQELDKSLQQNVNDLASFDHQQSSNSSSCHPLKRKNASSGSGSGPRNTSVYITGLTTYMACKQLEGMCMQLGKVRRIKFYEDERGRLKGDATVTFHSHAAMEKAIDRLDGFEIKPGVMLTASMAEFKKKQPTSTTPTGHSKPEGADGSHVVEASTANMTAGGSPPGTTSAVTSPRSESLSSRANEDLDLPSRAIILEGVFDPLELNEPSFVDELQQDMESECTKYGKVEMIHVRADGSVKIQFAELPSAIRCLQVMNGRWFGGRQLRAHFDPTQPEEAQDSDTKLQAFLASVG